MPEPDELGPKCQGIVGAVYFIPHASQTKSGEEDVGGGRVQGCRATRRTLGAASVESAASRVTTLTSSNRPVE